MTIALSEHQIHTRDYATWIEIDQEALEFNVEAIRAQVLPSAEILAVIKANGYGHGLLETARVLEKRVAYFGVASVDDALRLKQFEMTTPILLFGIHTRSEIKQAVVARIALSVSSIEQAELISDVCRELSHPVLVHIKVDTGMGRLGISIRDALQVIPKVQSLGMLQFEGIYTHFPIAEDQESNFTSNQVREFQLLIQHLDKKGIHFPFRHAANSSAIILHKDSHLNLVRSGLLLYGIYPDMKLRDRIGLRPVLSWRARVALVKELRTGETAGYGRAFIAKTNTRIAILPVGYSHGYPFALGNAGEVIINGKKHAVAGRVSMDYVAVHIGQDSVKCGDVATLLGRSEQLEISAESIAQKINSIPYEVVTRIQSNIPRIIKIGDAV